MKNLLKVRSMGRLSKMAIAVGGLGLAGVIAAGPAFAATGPSYGNSGLAGQSGNGTQVAHYSEAYTDSVFGAVSCTGVEQVKKGSPTQDSFTCTSTTGSPLTNVNPSQQITLSTIGGWISDHTPNLGLAKTFSGTVSSSGMSYTAVATY